MASVKSSNLSGIAFTSALSWSKLFNVSSSNLAAAWRAVASGTPVIFVLVPRERQPTLRYHDFHYAVMELLDFNFGILLGLAITCWNLNVNYALGIGPITCRYIWEQCQSCHVVALRHTSRRPHDGRLVLHGWWETLATHVQTPWAAKPSMNTMV